MTPTNHRVTSAESTDYNCVAWSVGDTTHWWQPGVYVAVQPPSCQLLHIVYNRSHDSTTNHPLSKLWQTPPRDA
ncbi:MAG TPA: hypothetical protein VKA46_08060, partial [Gemmataceae bacterium]|nr:hypothetical protein [Gemmataceae bacterium]